MNCVEQSGSAVIVQIGSPADSKLYVLAEASELLPVVRKITENAYGQLSRLDQRLELMLLCDPRRIAIADEYEKLVRKWIASITRLGAIPNGLWRVDFDTGEGYLCWRFPELKIGYFRDYDSEFDDRCYSAEAQEARKIID